VGDMVINSRVCHRVPPPVGGSQEDLHPNLGFSLSLGCPPVTWVCGHGCPPIKSLKGVSGLEAGSCPKIDKTTPLEIDWRASLS